MSRPFAEVRSNLGAFQVLAFNMGHNKSFRNKTEAEAYANILNAAFEAGRADMGRDIRHLIGAAKEDDA